MARREIAKSKGRRGPAPENKQSMVTMPGGRTQMLGPVAIASQTSPVYLAPRRESSNVTTLSRMPVKK